MQKHHLQAVVNINKDTNLIILDFQLDTILKFFFHLFHYHAVEISSAYIFLYSGCKFSTLNRLRFSKYTWFSCHSRRMIHLIKITTEIQAAPGSKHQKSTWPLFDVQLLLEKFLDLSYRRVLCSEYDCVLSAVFLIIKYVV